MFHFNGKLEGIVSDNLGCHHFNLKGDQELCFWTSFVKNEDFKAHVDGGWCPLFKILALGRNGRPQPFRRKVVPGRKGGLVNDSEKE